MAKPRGSFGIVALVVVVAIVLYLAARSTHRLLPTALDVAGKGGTPALRDLGVDNAGTLPDLGDMRRDTDRHSQQVQQTLAEID